MIENLCHRKPVLCLDETSSGLITFKDSFLSAGKFSEHSYRPVTLLTRGGGGTLGISGWGCAAGTLEPLTYTRASSAEFCYPILE